MHKNGSKYRRPLIAIGAVTLAATLVLGGTMAWQSISQEAKNENAHPVNAGGRLHDDFNGTNKDVYAENFGDTELIVRIRLDEFMEIGVDAGKENPGINKKREPVDADTAFDKPEGWKPHTLEGNLGSHAYLNYKLGGQTVYLPTFNKDKDSLDADINGTYKGAAEGQHFSDYKTYKVGTGVSGTESYGAGNNVEGQTHYPQLTANAQVISMETWKGKADGEKIGPFWVYDTDGWAYWAEPLLPATSTGLLLDEVQMTTIPDRDWYYAINVVAQFATLNDIGAPDDGGGTGTGFYDTTKGKAPTEDAKKLLESLKSHNTQRSALSSELSTKIRQANGKTDVVQIDGSDFYVLDVTGNQALLWSKDSIPNSTSKVFGPTYKWKESIARVECHRWLDEKPTLAKAALPQLIKTRKTHDSTEFEVTGDKIFLLSEADVLGTVDSKTALPDDYTYGKILKTAENQSAFGVGDGSSWWYLRSPRYKEGFAAYLSGGAVSYVAVSSGGALRPAVVVKLAAS